MITDIPLQIEEISPISLNIEQQPDIPTNIDMALLNITNKTFIYEQKVASDTWNINHNLKKYPSVTIVDSGGNKVVGETQYIDENNLIVSFIGAFSGIAYLN